MTPDPTTQPLYIPPEERVSLDEIKQRAIAIQNLAVVQVKDVAHEVYEQNVTRAAMVALGVVARRCFDRVLRGLAGCSACRRSRHRLARRRCRFSSSSAST